MFRSFLAFRVFRALRTFRFAKLSGNIASCRQINRDYGIATLICLGIGNRDFVDLVIPDQKRGDLFAWAVLEGKGIQVKPGTVQVIKINGLPVKNLEKIDSGKYTIQKSCPK